MYINDEIVFGGGSHGFCDDGDYAFEQNGGNGVKKLRDVVYERLKNRKSIDWDFEEVR